VDRFVNIAVNTEFVLLLNGPSVVLLVCSAGDLDRTRVEHRDLNALISFVVYVCPFVCRHVTTVVIKLHGLNIKEYTVDYNCIYVVI